MTQKKTPYPTKAESSAPNTERSIATSEEFNTLRSAFAQQGHRLHSVTAPGGSTTYWAERWGLARYLPSLHDAALFLAQIGGRL
jgi:hypothetical protein